MFGDPNSAPVDLTTFTSDQVDEYTARMHRMLNKAAAIGMDRHYQGLLRAEIHRAKTEARSRR